MISWKIKTIEMKFLTIESIRAHTKIFHDCEDEVLEAKGEAAEESILMLLNRSYEDLIETYGKVPGPIVEAALILTEHFYRHSGPTEPVNLSAVPYSYDYLVKPYMILY